MSTVRVEASRPYDVAIDECSIDEAGVLAASIGGDAAFVVSDSNVAPLYLERVMRSLSAAGFAVSEFVFAAGEASKNLSTYGSCLQAMAKAGSTRSSLVVALGGGVVGDMAGFAAATYMRGCRCIQIPTSLLACIDSSVGGKTAVDLPQGKNLVGAFFQPSAVLIDTTVLATLSPHFFTDGCAEAVKYGVIADAGLFSLLETPLVPGDARLADVIARCVAIKRDTVQADECEHGVRMLLNFGHTLGHAIEKASEFRITHGFAVASGMAMAARACAARGLCDVADAQRVASVVEAYGMSARAPFSPELLYEAALSDKKRTGGVMNVAAMEGIGRARVLPLDLQDFRRFVYEACS